MALTNPQRIVRVQQLVKYKSKLEAILQSKSIAAVSGLEATTVEGAIAELVRKISGLGSVYNVKGSVADYTALQAVQNPKAGDVYNVVAANGDTPAGTNYVWIGTEWDALGGTIDLSDYLTKTQVKGKGGAKKPVYFDADGLAQECEAFINTSEAATENGTDLSLVTTGEKYKWEHIANNAKTKQAAVVDPTADGDAVAFIDTISQNENGEVTVTKKTVASADASNAGLMSAAHYSKVEAIEYAENSDIDEIFDADGE